MKANQVEEALRARWRRYPLIGLVTWPFDDHPEGIAGLLEEFKRSHSPWSFWPRSFLRWMVSELHAEEGLGEAGVYAFLDEQLASGNAARTHFSISEQQKEIHEHFRARRSEMFICDTAAWEGPYYFVNLLKFHAVSPAGLSAQLRSALPSLKAHPDFSHLAIGPMSVESEQLRMADTLERISRDLGPGAWSGAPLAERLVGIASARPLLARAIRYLLSTDASGGDDEDDLFGYDSPSLSWPVMEQEWSEDGPVLRLPPLREGCTWWLDGIQVTGPEFDTLAPKNLFIVEIRDRGSVAKRFPLLLAPRAHSLESWSDADLERLLPGEHLILFHNSLLKNGRALDAEPVSAARWAAEGFKCARIELDAGDSLQIDGDVFEIPRHFLRPPQPTASCVLTEFAPPLITQWPIQYDNHADATLGLDVEIVKVGPDQRPQTGVPFKLRWRRRGRPVSDWAGPFVLAEDACMSRPSFRAEGVPWTTWLRIPGTLRVEAPGSELPEAKSGGWWLLRSSQKSQIVRILGRSGEVASALLSAPLVKWRLSTRGEETNAEWQTDPLRYDPERPWDSGAVDVFFDHQRIQCEFVVESFAFKRVSNREGFIRFELDRLREFGVGSSEARSLFIRNRDTCLPVVAPNGQTEPTPPPQPNELPPDGEAISLTWMPSVRRDGLLLPGEHSETVEVVACRRTGILRLVAEVSSKQLVSVPARVGPTLLNQEVELTVDLPDADAVAREMRVWFEFVPDTGEPVILHPCGEPFSAYLAGLQEWLEALLAEGASVSPLANRMRLFRALSVCGRSHERQHALRRWHEQSLLPREHLVALLGLGEFPVADWQLVRRELSDAGPEDDLDAFWIVHTALRNPDFAAEEAPATADWGLRPGCRLAAEVVRSIAGGGASGGWRQFDLEELSGRGGVSAALAGLVRLTRGWATLSGRLLPLAWNAAWNEWERIDVNSLPVEWQHSIQFLTDVARFMTGGAPRILSGSPDVSVVEFVTANCNLAGSRSLAAGAAPDEALEVIYLIADRDERPESNGFWGAAARGLRAWLRADSEEAAHWFCEAEARGDIVQKDYLQDRRQRLGSTI